MRTTLLEVVVKQKMSLYDFVISLSWVFGGYKARIDACSAFDVMHTMFGGSYIGAYYSATF